MTLDCVEISLARVFESGQAYVALSRARSLEGLRVLDFNPNVVKANQDVLLFYNKMTKERLLLQVSVCCLFVRFEMWDACTKLHSLDAPQIVLHFDVATDTF